MIRQVTVGLYLGSVGSPGFPFSLYIYIDISPSWVMIVLKYFFFSCHIIHTVKLLQALINDHTLEP
jgi:hypothetical protein